MLHAKPPWLVTPVPASSHPSGKDTSERKKYKVEWQVRLHEEWGNGYWRSYDEEWSELIENAYQNGKRIMEYKPGRRQWYRIDLTSMTQRRVSCDPAWANIRNIRRIFVPPGSDASEASESRAKRFRTVS